MAQSKLNLSNAQKQEVRRAIDRALEKGVPLEQKYRFLLFGDDNPTEFIWEGKTADTCTTVLPFQTIEQVDEPRPYNPLPHQPHCIRVATCLLRQ